MLYMKYRRKLEIYDWSLWQQSMQHEDWVSVRIENLNVQHISFSAILTSTYHRGLPSNCVVSTFAALPMPCYAWGRHTPTQWGLHNKTMSPRMVAGAPELIHKLINWGYDSEKSYKPTLYHCTIIWICADGNNIFMTTAMEERDSDDEGAAGVFWG